jgi:hypothetical protein
MSDTDDAELGLLRGMAVGFALAIPFWAAVIWALVRG